jgi:Spy/CpxP family protein refolding chaperone
MNMTRITFATAFAALLVAAAAIPTVAQAANARHPYHNINKVNDKGNNTGDAAVAKLNQQQLDQIRAGH